VLPKAGDTATTEPTTPQAAAPPAPPTPRPEEPDLSAHLQVPHSPHWVSVLEDAPEAPTILIVDDLDLNRHLFKAILKTGRYRILEARRPSQAFAMLDSGKVDLVVVDLMMPEMSGPEFCRLLKSDRRTQLTPILMVTGVQGAETEVAGLESGADDFLIRPLKPDLVRTRIRTMLRHKALTDLLDEAESILFALARSVEQRDRYTGRHCERLAAYSVALAQAAGLSKQDQLALFRGGFLHDIGKVGIPDSILFKRGLLSDAEWEIMRLHTVRGEEICRPMKTLAPVLPIIRSHHERWDGSGYPDGLRGEEIPLLPRVLQVADIYDALTTARPYKPALSHEEAVEIMLDEARRGWRDPELISLFAEISLPDFPGPSGWTDLASMQQSLDSMRRELAG
jgi:putative two-component system response regulator